MKYEIYARALENGSKEQITTAYSETCDPSVAFRLLLGMHDAFKDGEYFDSDVVVTVSVIGDEPGGCASHILLFPEESANCAIVDGGDAGYKWDEFASMWF